MSKGFDGFGACYFDGDRPVPQEVSLHIASGVLQIGLDDGRIIRWPVKEIRRLPDRAGRDRTLLCRAGDPLTRLEITDQEMLGYLPVAGRRVHSTRRLRLLAWGLAAVAAVWLQLLYLIPLLSDRLAEYIPPEGERALGEATLEQVRMALDETGVGALPLCDAPRGRAALDRMTERLAPGSVLPVPLSVSVLDHPMINAFALPGGQVVLFRGLLELAETPEEVAAVLAHEMGHVARRDPTRHALRSAGSIGVLGLVLGDFAGGAAVLFLTERLINARYSQLAETEADVYAREVLRQAGVAPTALALAFERMRAAAGVQEEDGEEGVIAHFLSHPSLSARIEAALRDPLPPGTAQAVLPVADWLALQSICER